jgi:hypothetical protein
MPMGHGIEFPKILKIEEGPYILTNLSRKTIYTKGGKPYILKPKPAQ